jgi:hypothetical protein
LVRAEPPTAGGDALAAVDGIRVLRPAGALIPAVFMPRAGADPAASGTVLSSGTGDDGAWTGRAAGWAHYDAGLADPTHREAYGFGVDQDTLADAVAGAVPPGFVVHDVTADPAEPAVAPGYRIRYVAEDEGIEAGLRVWAEGDLRREVALLRVLAEAEEVATVEVGGRPGVLARHGGGTWSVGWSPAEGVTAALIVAGDGMRRPQVEAIAGAVSTVGASEWAALVAERRS